jgi:hypothetical protein
LAPFPALFGLNHPIISEAQYSYLAATAIGSAVVPTIIANAFFMPSTCQERRRPGAARGGIGNFRLLRKGID